jgi:hypothetical protein
MYRLMIVGLTGVLAIAGSASGQRPRESLVDDVKRGIEQGVDYLRQQEGGRGNWERSASYPGGETSLVVLALLNSGVSPNDAVIQRGLRYLRTIPPSQTYVVGLQTMAFAEANQAQDKQRIAANVAWLVNGRSRSPAGGVSGWWYSANAAGSDNSNSQYALLGLYAGQQAGMAIPKDFWRAISDYYIRSQSEDGGWGYTPILRANSSLTMTVAGTCGLYIAGQEASVGEQRLDPKTGVSAACGQYRENDAIARGLAWIGRPGNFTFQYGGHTYYNVYGLERIGRLSGRRFIADRDWYREGCEFLLKQQRQDGSWPGGEFNGSSMVTTSFALLFLSKGRTPVLISKLAWGPGEDWNRKHHDVKNIAAYASKELFKGIPLAWQIQDARRMDGTDRNRILAEVGDLLMSPVVYMNGHRRPELTAVQKEILKQYLNEGGFVFAEACCGSTDFAHGFRELCEELFERKLTPVPADHAIYKAHALVDPNEFPLERLDLGCKTVLVLSPKPISGYIEDNLYKSGRGVLAFRLIGNIIAYATGMEPPLPRGGTKKVTDEKVDNTKLPRGFLKVAQLRHDGDWQPAPRAMRSLMKNLREEAKLDVALQTEEAGLNSQALLQFSFLYMHGRKSFAFQPGDLANLRATLRGGGVLLADACCGSKDFDKRFREFAAALFPENKLESIPSSDELFGREINGFAVANVRCRKEMGDGRAGEFEVGPPQIEGIRVNGRWVVIYSKYDIGCALEKGGAPDCLGHDHESALKIAGAAVLYSLKR